MNDRITSDSGTKNSLLVRTYWPSNSHAPITTAADITERHSRGRSSFRIRRAPSEGLASATPASSESAGSISIPDSPEDLANMIGDLVAGGDEDIVPPAHVAGDGLVGPSAAGPAVDMRVGGDVDHDGFV